MEQSLARCMSPAELQQLTERFMAEGLERPDARLAALNEQRRLMRQKLDWRLRTKAMPRAI